MSGNKLIVDTNIVLYFLKGNPGIIRFFFMIQFEH